MTGSIHIEGMVAKRGTFQLKVDELSISQQEVFAIVGETGAGKTVLLEAIAGAYPVSEGDIFFGGKSAGEFPVRKRNFGIVYQDHALFPHLTVRDNIAFGLRMARLPKEEIATRVDEMLEMFGISHIADRYPGVISGGESQRTALARALVMNPDVLLLDEPFSALDPTTKKKMHEMLRTVHERFSCTIIFVTHDFNEAISLADRVGIILDGRLQTVCDADELLTREFSPNVMRFLGR